MVSNVRWVELLEMYTPLYTCTSRVVILHPETFLCETASDRMQRDVPYMGKLTHTSVVLEVKRQASMPHFRLTMR